MFEAIGRRRRRGRVRIDSRVTKFRMGANKHRHNATRQHSPHICRPALGISSPYAAVAPCVLKPPVFARYGDLQTPMSQSLGAIRDLAKSFIWYAYCSGVTRTCGSRLAEHSKTMS